MSANIQSKDTANPKLPFWKTVGLSYSTFFHQFEDVLRISWLWLFLLVPLTSATNWMETSWLADAIANKEIPAGLHEPIRVVLLDNLSNIVILLACVSIAVAWHRRLILNETPKLSGGNVADGHLWRYIGTGVLICLMAWVPALAIILPVLFWLTPLPASDPVTILIGCAIYAGATTILLRLCLLLPARAVGHANLTIRQSWNRTRGNSWRILGGIAICTVPPIAIATIAMTGLFGFPTAGTVVRGAIAGQITAVSAFFLIYYILTMPIWVGFLSHAYRHLVPEGAKRGMPQIDEPYSSDSLLQNPMTQASGF